MQKQKYRKAMGVAYSFNYLNYKDLCHDAFLVYFTRTGKDLFEQDEMVIYLTIKRLSYDQRKKIHNPQRRGDLVYTFHSFVEFGEDFREYIMNRITPEDQLITKEAISNYLRFGVKNKSSLNDEQKSQLRTYLSEQY